MNGRTVIKFTRTYYDGYDISGYERTIGPLACTFPEVDLTVITDPLHGFLPGQTNITPGNYTGIFAKDTAGDIVTVGDAGKGLGHDISVAIGIQAVPAAGDPVFAGTFDQKAFTAAIDKAGGVTVAMPFGGWNAAAASNAYGNPWGRLQHALGAETAANTAIGMDWGAGTALGGYAVFHLMSSDNAVTLAVQHSTTTNVDGSFSNLITSGSLDASSTPKHILVALAKTATVGQFTRWNISLGSATTCTFVCSFVRGNQ
jgi:hypothetical protein